MMRRVSFVVIILCIAIAFKNITKKPSDFNRWNPHSNIDCPLGDSDPSPLTLPNQALFLSVGEGEKEEGGSENDRFLEYDFYRDSCPRAEDTIRTLVRNLQKERSNVAPALLRLVFHDCFIKGCDASILLDDSDSIDSEKNSPPNESLRGFDIIDIIKEQLEELCPGVVSCADILVLAAREAVVVTGGPFYPLFTGRRDSTAAFSDTATFELPSPNADLSDILATFASRGFDSRETVSLLGSHSIGVAHCKFFKNRLHNFGSTNKPDPSLDPGFLRLLRSRCRNLSSPPPSSSPGSTLSSLAPSPDFDGSPSSSAAASPDFDDSPSSLERPSPKFDSSPSSLAAPSPNFGDSPSSSSALSPNFHTSLSSPTTSMQSFEDSLSLSPEEPAVNLTYDGPESGFGPAYYGRLLQNKGIFFSDQQLMAGKETGIWVRVYASDVSLFRRDFALAMMKLSNLHVLTGAMGQIRFNCSRVA